MADTYRVQVTYRAQGQLLDIVEYLRERSPQGADRMGEKLRAAIDSLERFPQRFRLVDMPDESEAPVRAMPVPPYSVKYDIDEENKVVNVLSVRHGARTPR